MSDSERFPPARGDESELFREFNPRLVSYISDIVWFTTPHTVEDACGHAWAQFMRYQPDRASWQAWLIQTAQREAWALERVLLREWLKARVLATSHPSKDHAERDEYELRTDVDEALSLLAELPRRPREVALLRAFGLSHAEIVELTGASERRVQKLITEANHLIGEHLADRSYADTPSSRRAERLQWLEREPPAWLVAVIGPPIRPTVKRGGMEARRDWRRAALAIDDYRSAVGADRFFTDRLEPPAERSLRYLYAAALYAIRDMDRHRGTELER
jgi:DNA-directed RNA polymerase specialized sigma24 family protein